jgi:predicted HTH transcriptional regulator
VENVNCLQTTVNSNISDGFQVVVFDRYNENISVNDGVNDGVNMLLKLVEDYPGIKSAELREKLNVSQRTVERWLKYLRDEKKIVFKGAFKTGGYWLIKGNRHD